MGGPTLPHEIQRSASDRVRALSLLPARLQELGCLPLAGLDRHVVVGEAERFHLLGVVGMVGDDRDDLCRQGSRLLAVEQVVEAVRAL